MEIIFAGVWTGRNRKDFNGKQVAVLFGDADAYRGARLGVPVTVERDDAAPLRLSIIGEWGADVAASARDKGKKGASCVVIAGTHAEIVAIARGGNFGGNLRLTYP